MSQVALFQPHIMHSAFARERTFVMVLFDSCFIEVRVSKAWGLFYLQSGHLTYRPSFILLPMKCFPQLVQIYWFPSFLWNAAICLFTDRESWNFLLQYGQFRIFFALSCPHDLAFPFRRRSKRTATFRPQSHWQRYLLLTFPLLYLMLFVSPMTTRWLHLKPVCRWWCLGPPSFLLVFIIFSQKNPAFLR